MINLVPVLIGECLDIWDKGESLAELNDDNKETHYEDRQSLPISKSDWGNTSNNKKQQLKQAEESIETEPHVNEADSASEETNLGIFLHVQEHDVH